MCDVSTPWYVKMSITEQCAQIYSAVNMVHACPFNLVCTELIISLSFVRNNPNAGSDKSAQSQYLCGFGVMFAFVYRLKYAATKTLPLENNAFYILYTNPLPI